MENNIDYNACLDYIKNKFPRSLVEIVNDTYIVIDGSKYGLENKKRKINQGDTKGFFRLDRIWKQIKQ